MSSDVLHILFFFKGSIDIYLNIKKNFFLEKKFNLIEVNKENFYLSYTYSLNSFFQLIINK